MRKVQNISLHKDKYRIIAKYLYIKIYYIIKEL